MTAAKLFVAAAALIAQSAAWLPQAGPLVRAQTRRSAAGVWADQKAANQGVVKTVSETCQEFYGNYNKAIAPVFRTSLNEIMQTTHLAKVDARYEYDALFARGFCSTFDTLFAAYPGAGEKEAIYTAMTDAIGLDGATLRADGERFSAWVKATGVEGVKAAANDASAGEFNALFAAMKADTIGMRLYTRSQGIGMFTILQDLDVELNVDSIKEWAEALGLTASKVEADYSLYSSTLEKLAAVEQMMKEVEIREKKQMADRLEEKASKAAKAAAKASGDVADDEAAEAPKAEGSSSGEI